MKKTRYKLWPKAFPFFSLRNSLKALCVCVCVWFLLFVPSLFRGRFGFALLGSVIGFEMSRHFLSQSELGPELLLILCDACDDIRYFTKNETCIGS